MGMKGWVRIWKCELIIDREIEMFEILAINVFKSG